MIVSFIIAIAFLVKKNIDIEHINALVSSGMSVDQATALIAPFKEWQELVIGITITTIVWVIITYMTKPVDKKTLISFIKTVQPSGPGWKKILDQARADGEIIDKNIGNNNFPLGIACMVAGCFAIYGALFATGYWIYSQYVLSTVLALVTVVSSLFIWKVWKKVTE